MTENILLWLEDRPKTIEKYITYCEEIGFTIKMVPTVHEFFDFLESNKEKICLILVDLMLYGVSSLETIGIMDSDTSAGYDAGWVIIERLLRPNMGEAPFAHIPVAVMSARTPTPEDKLRLTNFQNIGLNIPYFEKFGISPEGISWEKKLKEFITDIKNSMLK